jgi:hypothetical protein
MRGVLIDEGFALTTTLDLARNEILEGIGFNLSRPGDGSLFDRTPT